MMDTNLIWLGLAIYACVLLLFLVLTRKEQKTNKLPWRQAVVGFGACLVWPATLVFFVVMMLRRRSAD